MAIFFFFVFLIYNDVQFKCTQRCKNNDDQRTQRLYMRTIIHELNLLKKIVIIWYNIRAKRFTIICNQVNKKISDPSNIKEYY